ncbi:PIR Superfamily Protein [Plasmodium ovale curtisi]|uniref:PIR Superfamily Protein n=1 Tax=Plasmodium ovale curtisi TaxID=864141 RepID=A0A1A8WLW5_PLAOA|nr:PIR Superfamily Protein [Plasmodium ovale curtisi]
MSTVRDDFRYEEFKGKHKFLETLEFGKIYEAFNNKIIQDITSKQNCIKNKVALSIPDYYYEIPLNFCIILYNILANAKGWQNDFYDDITKDEKMYCISLKYWLYEKIGNHEGMGISIDKLFQNWKNILVRYRVISQNIATFHKNKNIECKYLDYLGKGLKEYHESLIECSSEKQSHNFCKELDEFQKMHNIYNIYWKNSAFSTRYVYNENSNENCPLEIESAQNPIRIKYKEKNNILYLSDQSMDSIKSSIISVSSSIGTTVGLSVFLLYLYKYTSFGSVFRTRTQKDNAMFNNISEEIHGFILPNSENSSKSFENSEYNVSYYSLNNS